MNAFQILTPMTYWLLVGLWVYILAFLLRRLRLSHFEKSLLNMLIVILAIDALRTLFESIYFGVSQTSLFGFLPIGVYDFLVRPEIIIIPKTLNVIAAVLMIGILLYKWFPAEKRDRELQEGIITKRTTELKKSKEAIARTAKEWQITFNASNDGIWLLDVEHRIVRSNRQADRLFPSSAGGKGTRCWEVAHGTTGPIADCPVVRAKESLQHETMELQMGDLWYLVTADPILDSNGHYAGAVHAFRDITERKQTIERLARQTALLNETQQLTHVGGWQWNVEQQTMTWTDELYRIHGGSPDEFDLGGPRHIEHSLEFYDPKVRPTIKAAFDRCVTEGQPYDLESPFTTADGTRKWIRTIGRAVLEKDRVVRVFGTVLDITKQRETELQLRQAHKMESIGQLAGGVAHEFNNKLQVILGHTEMAMTNIQPEDRLHKNLIEIQKAALYSATLARQLLTFARKQIITPEALNLNTTLEPILKMIQRLVGENITLVWLPTASLWPIEMDPSQIEQILTNLSMNARDAIYGTGEIHIKTANVTLDQVPSAETCPPGEYVQLSFSDDGCGMNEETLSHLFEPFFTTKEVGQGTGRGLPTLYGIIQQNHGFITADSTLGKGSTFEIYLPRCADPKTEAEEKIPPPPSGDGHETILLVDDDPALLNLGRQMLEVLGYTVLAANLPDEAICLAKEHGGKIDLLLTDVIMPDMNGQDLATHLMGLRPDLKCLFMSGYTAEMIARDNVLLKDIPFIQKPFSTAELADKLHEVLDRERV